MLLGFILSQGFSEFTARAVFKGNYARIFFGDGNAMVQRSLNQLEERLDPARFFRASRQALINLDHVHRIDPFFKDRLLITLKDGHEVQTSRRQALKLRSLMGV